MKRGKGGAAEIFVKMLAVTFAAALLISGDSLSETRSEYRAGEKSYETLRRYAEILPAPPTGADVSPEPKARVYDSGGARKKVPAFDPRNAVAHDSAAAPDHPVDFDALKAINGDVRAWLRCPGTNIDYPVAQGADNGRYLRRLITGEVNRAGTLFVDWRNRAFEDRNTIIYGHNMKDGSMFHALLQYKRQAFYDGHPVMRIWTLEGTYAVELFAGYVAGADSGAWRLAFRDDAEFDAWLREARSRSAFQSDIRVNADDKVVTLSTCSDDFPGAKYVVVGRLKEG